MKTKSEIQVRLNVLMEEELKAVKENDTEGKYFYKAKKNELKWVLGIE